MTAHKRAAGELQYMALVGSLARALRESHNQQQTAAAAAVGLSLSSYKRLERGEYMPSGYNLQRIARHFGLDANLLVFGFTLIGDPQIDPERVVRRWQRLVYRLRALDLQTQMSLEQLVVDLYEQHLERGGSNAEVAAAEAERRLLQMLEQRED